MILMLLDNFFNDNIIYKTLFFSFFLDYPSEMIIKSKRVDSL